VNLRGRPGGGGGATRTDPAETSGLVLDRTVRTLHHGTVLIGGHPGRLMVLSPTGAEAFARLLEGAPAAGAAQALARRLVGAGMAHPRPVSGGRTRPDPSATVVVPVRDRSASLDRCLQALGTETAVVVVDDGSDEPDAVAEVVARHGARLIRRAVNGGPGAARNEALAGLTTELVAFVDSDCTVTPGWLPSLLWLFDDPAVGAVAPRIRPEPRGPIDDRSVRARYAADRSALDLGPEPSEVGPGRPVRYVPSTALVVRVSMLGGGFDEDLRIGEDVDWVWRLLDAGRRIRYEPSVTVFHREPDSWSALLARRFRYGTAAAPLARRHPGRLAPLELHPWPTAVVGALLARRAALSAALMVGSTVRLSRGLRARGVPVRWSLRWALQGVGWTTVGLGRALTMLAGPLLAGPLLAGPLLAGGTRRSRRFALVVALLVALPPAVEWVQRRPRLDPVRWAAISFVDDVAYGAGVWWGCLRWRSVGPLVPSIRTGGSGGTGTRPDR
jgi:mycofactocin glycosyltransferase